MTVSPVPTSDAHSSYPRWWDAYFGLVAVAVGAVALFGIDHALWRRALAVGAITAMGVLHATAGRHLMERRAAAGRVVGYAVLTGQIALFVVAIAAVPFTTWLLFAVTPMFFQIAPMRDAVVAIIGVNLITPVVHLFQRPADVPVDLAVAAISSATGVWLGFWIMRVIQQNVERGRLIAELEATRAQVARLSHETGVMTERARLAGEIHDTLAQGFASIITLLQAADPQLRDERLALAVRTAKENLAESRALLTALAPAALSEGSLPDAVRRQVTRFAEETGVPATVRVTGADRALPTNVEVVLLRSTQEALTNVRRHAGADEVAVLLAYTESAVRLVVRDDGGGFDPAAAAGFGLTGMRSRAAQVNGVLTVRSGHGVHGTTIELEVPA